ncbi:hypothetical protein [Neorhizobium vignae]|uniref:hypothetical protein n=1 Tax=Neorhizobium vignae TaxID=690585 RepID=UPI003D81134C
MTLLNHQQPSFICSSDESHSGFFGLGSPIEDEHEHPERLMEILTIFRWPVVEQAVGCVPRTENQVMVSRSVQLNRDWNVPINIEHQNPTASCGNVDMGFSRGGNEGPANIVRIVILVERFEAGKSSPGHRRAAFDRPFGCQDLDCLVRVSHNAVSAAASQPEFHGAEGRFSAGSHNAVPHANHPTQRITLGLVPVECGVA